MTRAVLILALSLCACEVPSALCTSAAPNRCGATAAAPAQVDAGAMLAASYIDGDSITLGWTAAGRGHWPDGVVNLGTSGQQACSWTRAAQPGWFRPQTGYLMIGVNDLSSSTPAQIWSCTESILAGWATLYPWMRIKLLATMLRGAGDPSCDTHNAALDSLRALQLASEYDVSDPGSVITCNEECPTGGAVRTVMCATATDDGLHPNAAGYTAWAAALGLP